MTNPDKVPEKQEEGKGDFFKKNLDDDGAVNDGEVQKEKSDAENQS